MSNRAEERISKTTTGQVIKNAGNTYWVRNERGDILVCNAKGNLRLKEIRSTSPIVVGDTVTVQIQPDGAALITNIGERRNYIVRKASNLSKQSHILAANIDCALLCITVRYPETTTVFIDRFLVTAEAYSVSAVLLFNKIDIYDAEDREYLEALVRLYSSIGYRCVKTSVVTGEGLDAVQEAVSGKVVLLAGHSGVGKSSILNSLLGKSLQKVGEISQYHKMGVHTTTFTEMIELPNGGYMIDTPGIKGFGTIDMTIAEVSHYFPEIFNISHRCKYYNCLHLNEPECAVLKAVEEHYISESRYRSYLNILTDMDAGKYR